MPSTSIADLFPLTPGQEDRLARVLAGTRPGTAHLDVEISGAPETSALAGALRALAARHPALRTAFTWERTPAPLQLVRAHGAVPVEEADLRGAGRDDVAERVGGFAGAAGWADPARLPLVRAALYRTGQETHRLVWCWHPLVLDVRGALVLTRDALALCAGLPLPPAQPFREVAAAMEPRDPASWRARLERAARMSAPAPDRVHAEAELPPGTMEAAGSAARRYRISREALARGAWALVLAERSAADEVEFGAVSAGLPPGVERAEGIVGPVEETRPVRVRVRWDEIAWRWLDAPRPGGPPVEDGGSAGESAVRVRRDVPLVHGFVIRVVGDGGPPAAPLEAALVPGERWIVRVEGDADVAANLSRRFASFVAALASHPDLPLRDVVDRAAGEREPAPTAAPLSATERTIAAAWAEVLGVPRVRRGDNFFEMGGDSLLVIRVFRRLRDAVGDRVTMADMFQHRTLAELARHLDAPGADGAEREAQGRADVRRAFAARAGAARASVPPLGAAAGDE